MPSRNQIRAALQRQSLGELRRTQKAAADECKRLAPQLAELEETAQDTPELQQVRSLFDEVCMRAQEADTELARRTSGAGAPQRQPEPEPEPATPPAEVPWPWVIGGLVGAGGLLAYLAKSKAVARQRAALMRGARRLGRKIRR